ncbi:MAG: hypothetical protein ACKOB4_05725, partial [Acidobacteriota bacterium]
MKRSSSSSDPGQVFNRRRFLGGAASLTALPELFPEGMGSLATTWLPGDDRATRAHQIRIAAAERQHRLSTPLHQTNGDEDLYPQRIGNFSKTLPHNHLGEVDRAAYQRYLDVLRSGAAEEFNNLTVGGAGRLTSPQAGLA